MHTTYAGGARNTTKTIIEPVTINLWVNEETKPRFLEGKIKDQSSIIFRKMEKQIKKISEESRERVDRNQVKMGEERDLFHPFSYL